MFSSRSLAHTTSRRRFLGGTAVGAAGLAALGLGMSGVPGVAPQTASAQSGPWAGGDIPAAARSGRQMAVAARTFLNSLDRNQLGTAWYPDLADAARTKWSNFPAGASPRAGIALADTSFAWYGPTTSGSASYFRVQGPTLWIEFAPQGGGDPGGGGPGGGGAPGAKPSGGGTGAQPRGSPPAVEGLGLGGAATTNHIHTIYRDPTNEYGAKWTSP